MSITTNYQLYYWPVPFRGNFIRIIFHYLEMAYEEKGMDAVLELRQSPVDAQHEPVMTVPALFDSQVGRTLSQMPAIAYYLGEKHQLLPEDLALKAVTLKLLGDCTDVLAELTRHEGTLMWTQEAWDEFKSTRLIKWMRIFEIVAQHHGIAQHGHMLTENITVADLAMVALWQTLFQSFPKIQEDLQKHAPQVDQLVKRLSQLPNIQSLFTANAEMSGNTYCGGQIEQSMRALSM